MSTIVETVVPTLAPAVLERRELVALGERIAESAAHLAAATGVWLGLVAEFDRRGGWAHPGLLSCAHWLSWRCGLGITAAREHVRVARALTELPLLAAELATGRLSYSKVRAVTRVANPVNEAHLVEVARCSTGADLERLIGGLRRAKNLAEVRERHSRRSLSWRWDEDGTLVLRGRFNPEDGAVVLAALEAMRGDVSAESSTPTNSPAEDAGACAVVRTVPNLNADCLVALAQSTLDHLADTTSSGGSIHVVNLHVDLDDLLAPDPDDADPDDADPDDADPDDADPDDADPDDADPDDADPGAPAPAVTDCGPRIENGPAVHPETLRRILCDSATVVVAHHRTGRGGTSMDIGRRSRVVPARLRRALVLRDEHCAAPGCTATRDLHCHHVIHWSRGGPTALWNLILLCPAHHHLVHEGGCQVQADGRGGFVFHTPDGTLIQRAPAPPACDAAAIVDLHQASIDSRTATPHWHGEKLDLHYAVEVLLLAESHAARALADDSAETTGLPEGWSLN